MDSSVLPDPVLIRGNRESVMFICKDDSIYGMGKGLFGVEDKGWLRKIPTPPECSDFAVDEHTGQIKAAHGQGFRLVLTKSGKLFVNGRDFDDQNVMSLLEPGPVTEEGDLSAMTSFKELDL